MSLIAPLFEGNLDVIGDIHGEIGALSSLLSRLGYDGNGRHPEGHRLVFLGDLVDRGPDSIAVFRLVQHLVNKGNAQCVVGNHELNLLRIHESGDGLPQNNGLEYAAPSPDVRSRPLRGGPLCFPRSISKPCCT